MTMKLRHLILWTIVLQGLIACPLANAQTGDRLRVKLRQLLPPRLSNDPYVTNNDERMVSALLAEQRGKDREIQYYRAIADQRTADVRQLKAERKSRLADERERNEGVLKDLWKIIALLDPALKRKDVIAKLDGRREYDVLLVILRDRAKSRPNASGELDDKETNDGVEHAAGGEPEAVSPSTNTNSEDVSP